MEVRIDSLGTYYGPSIGVCLGSADMGASWRGNETNWWFLDNARIYGTGGGVVQRQKISSWRYCHCSLEHGEEGNCVDCG